MIQLFRVSVLLFCPTTAQVAMQLYASFAKKEYHSALSALLRAYPKTCFAYPSASERIIGKAREAGVSSGYVDAAERSIGFVQPREVQMRFSDRLLMRTIGQ